MATAYLPPALEDIVAFFANLSEGQRRDALLAYAAEAQRHAPREEEIYVASDEEIDPGCVDTVGLFLGVNPNGGLYVRAKLGPEVQTLTRAMVAILCRGLEGVSPATAAGLPDGFIPGIVGEPLMRTRARSVYHVLRRLRRAVESMPRNPSFTSLE